MNYNTTQIEYFLHKLEEDIGQNVEDQLTLIEMRKNMMDAYYRYQAINKDLIELFECMLLTIRDCKSYQFSQIAEFTKRITVNEISFQTNDIQRNSIKETIYEITNFFLHYNIITCVNPSEYTRKIIKRVNFILILDNGYLACAIDHHIEIWDSNSLLKINTLQSHQITIGMLFLLNHNQFMSYSYDGIIKIWEYDKISYTNVSTLYDYLIFLPSIPVLLLTNGLLLTPSQRSQISILNSYTFQSQNHFINQMKLQLKISQDTTKGLRDYYNIKSMIQIKNGNLITALCNKVIYVWDIMDFKCIDKFEGNNHVIRQLFEVKENTVAVVSDTTIMVWDTYSKKCINNINIAETQSLIKTSTMMFIGEKIILYTNQKLHIWKNSQFISEVSLEMPFFLQLIKINDHQIITIHIDYILIWEI